LPAGYIPAKAKALPYEGASALVFGLRIRQLNCLGYKWGIR